MMVYVIFLCANHSYKESIELSHFTSWRIKAQANIYKKYIYKWGKKTSDRIQKYRKDRKSL